MIPVVPKISFFSWIDFEYKRPLCGSAWRIERNVRNKRGDESFQVWKLSAKATFWTHKTEQFLDVNADIAVNAKDIIDEASENTNMGGWLNDWRIRSVLSEFYVGKYLVMGSIYFEQMFTRLFFRPYCVREGFDVGFTCTLPSPSRFGLDGFNDNDQ